jgi:hypothetical protein
VNAFTTTISTSPVIPATPGAVFAVNVEDTSWMSTGQMLHLAAADTTPLGDYQLFTIVSLTQVFLKNLRDDSIGAYPNNANGSTITIGSKVSADGLQGPPGLPMVTSSGGSDPVAAPAGGASGWYVQTGVGGTYWYFNPSVGSWTDTTISVIGPAGATGAQGANGHTPVLTMTTLAPSGGAAGDWHIQQVNGGKWQVYYNNGAWVGFAAGTILGNRLLGYSMVSAVPNPGNLPANASDYYWTYVAGRLIFWVCTVAGAPGTWVAAIDILMTGGSGAPVDAEYIVASSNATLSNERVANATATVVPDSATPGIMKWNVPDDGITNAKLNNVPSNTFKGLGLGGPANPIDLTANQASAILDTATDPFVRASAIPGGTSTFQSISDGSPVLGDGRQTGTNVWTMQRAIQYVPNAQSSAGTGTTLTFETDSYEQHDLTLTHDSVTLAYDPPIHDTANFLFSINNTTGGELSFLYSAGAWQANEGVTVPYTLLGGAKVALIAHYYDGFMVITAVIQNPTTL